MTKAREIAELGQKLTVDASGNVDIAGDITSDGLTVDGTTAGVVSINSTANGSQIAFDSASTPTSWDVGVSNSADGDFLVYQSASGSGEILLYTNGKNRLGVEADGDIRFGSETNYAWMRPYETTTGNLVISADGGATGTNGSAIKFRTRGADKMIIQHDGNVGIGNTIPSSFYYGADDLVVGYNDGPHGITIYTGSTNSGALYFADGTTGDAEYRGGIAYIHDASDANENLALVSGGATQMRIRTTGYAELASASQVRLTLGNAGTAGANTANWIRGTGNALGLNAASDNIHFEIGGTERMRIQGANVGIGTSSPSSILHIEGNTNAFTTAPILYFGSTSTASAEVRDWAIGPADDNYGNFHIFRGTSTGSNPIGHDGKVFTIASSGKVGIGISSPARQLHIGAADNTNHDAVIRLNSGGATGSRAGIEFHYETASTARARLSVNSSTLELEADINGTKVAAFDGDGLKMTAGKGIKFDAFGSGNILDDYEEGTWTVFEKNGQATLTTNRAHYTKIGNMVYAAASVGVGSTTNVNHLNFTLPFTSTINGYYLGGGNVSYHTLASGQSDNLRPNIENAADNVLFFYNANDTVTCAQASGRRIDFFVIYHTHA